MEVLNKPSERGTNVIYGLYDSSSQSLMIRLNDFLIDRSRISVQERSYFYHLLAVMLDAGIPIIKALQVLTKRTHNERFTRIINTMAYDVERGRKISQSMAKFPDIFPESDRGIVKSGESIGNLEGLLFRLAKQTRRTHELFLKVRTALIYPATVLFALLVSGAIVVTIVIPRLNDFFVQANVEMPLLTQIILGVGQFFIQFLWLLVILGVFVALVLSFYLSTDSGKRRFDRFLLSAPWVSGIIRRLNITKFVQLLSLMVEAGVPIHQALKITGEAMNNRLYRDFIFHLRQDVERGERIAENLGEAPFLFPETVVAMIAVGESTGQLGLIADKLATHYESEVEHSLSNLTAILEPLVILLVGIAVGIFALGLLGPIFSLPTLVS